MNRVIKYLFAPLIIALGAIYATVSMYPSTTVGKSVLARGSMIKIQQMIAACTIEPHPVGSAANQKVCQLLLDNLQSAGLRPAMELARISTKKRGEVTLRNIVLEIPGESHDAVLFVAHYDSVERGPGAADDFAAVASLIEVAKLASSSGKPKNTIIFLLTDGEELGMLGAKQFINSSSRMKEVKFVVNFDARGTCGPVFMFETSPLNDQLIKFLSDNCSFVIATSVAQRVYGYMPNKTDFTVLSHTAHVPGMNFAFIDGREFYHTKNDTLENLSNGTLVQLAETIMELTTAFWRKPIPASNTSALVYFTFSPEILVQYTLRSSYAIATSISLIALLILCIFWRYSIIRLKHVLRWTVYILSIATLCGAALLLIELIFGKLRQSANSPSGTIWVIDGLIIAAASWWCLVTRRFLDALESICVDLIIWVIAVLVGMLDPGIAYPTLELLCLILVYALAKWKCRSGSRLDLAGIVLMLLFIYGAIGYLIGPLCYFLWVADPRSVVAIGPLAVLLSGVIWPKLASRQIINSCPRDESV